MVGSIAELEGCLGKPGLPVQLKAIDHLDSYARRWISAAPFFAIVAANDRVHATLGGAKPAAAATPGEKTLVLDRGSLDVEPAVAEKDGIACLFFVPGVTETLRVNGRVSAIAPSTITVHVDECFVHCGKAMIRSAFWSAPQSANLQASIVSARFCVLGTADERGNADASPKGDPSGFIAKLDDATFALPDRPGNRRADGHRNIIAQDNVALLAITPGSATVSIVEGRARLTRDAALLAPMAVDGKVPVIATTIAVETQRDYRSNALTHFYATRDTAERETTDPAATLVAHVKLNQTKGLAAAALRLAITPATTQSALAHDYKVNLY